MKRSWLPSILLLCCVACSKPLPELENFDREVWRADRNGCNESRGAFHNSLMTQRDKLKGLSERDVVKVLGAPDRNDLSEHHEKFYYYFITPGPGCDSVQAIGLSLVVRFNATGVSKEVVIE